MTKFKSTCIVLGAIVAFAMDASEAQTTIHCGNGALKVHIGTGIAKFIDASTFAETDEYDGSGTIRGIEKCGEGVVTIFSEGGIYFSPDCRSIGRDGAGTTVRIYPFDGDSSDSIQTATYVVSDGEEVRVKFERGGSYRTEGCTFGGSRDAMRTHQR